MADVSITDASSSESEAGDDSDDSSLDMGEQRATSKRKTKKRSKRNVGKNQTEHSFTPSTGETGWVSFCLGASTAEDSKKEKAKEEGSASWVFVELLALIPFLIQRSYFSSTQA